MTYLLLQPWLRRHDLDHGGRDPSAQRPLRDQLSVRGLHLPLLLPLIAHIQAHVRRHQGGGGVLELRSYQVR